MFHRFLLFAIPKSYEIETFSVNKNFHIVESSYINSEMCQHQNENMKMQRWVHKPTVFLVQNDFFHDRHKTWNIV